MMLHAMVTDIKESSRDGEAFITPENEGEIFMRRDYYYINLSLETRQYIVSKVNHNGIFHEN